MKNKISRRQFLQVAGASAAALLLASCSGNSASSVSSSSVASSAASSVAASSAAASSKATSTVTTTGKTLVVYFSATGTTEGVAQTIADTVGADLFGNRQRAVRVQVVLYPAAYLAVCLVNGNRSRCTRQCGSGCTTHHGGGKNFQKTFARDLIHLHLPFHLVHFPQKRSAPSCKLLEIYF